MYSRISPVPGDRSAGAPTGADAADGLGDRLATVVATARRRASRDGHRQLDTAHLLHSLLESDRVVWDFLDDGGSQQGKLLGYLVQRSIGYGLRWQGTVEDSGAVPALPESHRASPGAGSGGDRPAGWSPVAAAALEHARSRARARNAREVAGMDLFAGLVADEECRAVEVLERAGVDTGALVERLRVVPGQRRCGGRGSAHRGAGGGD